MRNRPIGVSLIEAIIALTIFSIVSGLAITAMVQAGRYQQRLLTSQDLESECRKIIRTLSEDLLETSLGHLHVEPNCIVFPSSRDIDQVLTTDPVTGQLLWSKFWCYYLDPADKKLYKKFEIRPSTPQPEKSWLLSPPRDRVYFLSGGQTSRIVSSSVESFAVRLLKPDTATGPRALQPATPEEATLLDIEMELKVISHDQPVGIKFSSKVVPRN